MGQITVQLMIRKTSVALTTMALLLSSIITSSHQLDNDNNNYDQICFGNKKLPSYLRVLCDRHLKLEGIETANEDSTALPNTMTEPNQFREGDSLRESTKTGILDNSNRKCSNPRLFKGTATVYEIVIFGTL